MLHNVINATIAACLIFILAGVDVPLGEAAIAGTLWGILLVLGDISKHVRK